MKRRKETKRDWGKMKGKTLDNLPKFTAGEKLGSKVGCECRLHVGAARAGPCLERCPGSPQARSGRGCSAFWMVPHQALDGQVESALSC
mgnify:CR=1 FL=1|jgi:hypothetical protein